MSKKFEVLNTIVLLGDNASPLPIFEYLDEKLSLGTIYTILEELEAGGEVTREERPGGPERSYRDKCFFKLTDKGKKTITDAQRAKAAYPVNLLPENS